MGLSLPVVGHSTKTTETATVEEMLFRIIHNKGYMVVYENLKEGLEGYCWPAKKKIGLAKYLLSHPIDHKCTLAHETSHVIYPPVYNTIQYHQKSYWQLDNFSRSNLMWKHAKNEVPGLIWMTSFLIPDDDFWDFAKSGPWDWQDWLERFQVNDKVMNLKMGYMRTKQWFKWREMVRRVPPESGFGA